MEPKTLEQQLERQNAELKAMLTDAMNEWRAWAKDSGCDLDQGWGPDFAKFQKFKKRLQEIHEGR